MAAAAGENPNFHLVATMTEIRDSRREWKGETGFINKDKLARHLPALQGGIYYVAGPPAMVEAMRSKLVEAAMDEDDVRTEEFSGY